MDKISRRTAIVATGTAVAGGTLPSLLGDASATELPVTRVNRLAGELAQAMSDWMMDLGIDGKPDLWKAHVYPDNFTSYPVCFEHIRTQGRMDYSDKGAPPADALSFVKRRKPKGGGFNYWCVQSTGKYEDDWKLGKRLGIEFVNFLRMFPTYGNATLLALIAQDMPRKFTGIESGFMREVSNAAILGAHLHTFAEAVS